MEINKSNQVKSVAFQGYQHKKTETGAQAYEFNCIYDSKKYDCELQCFKVELDGKKNYVITRGCNDSMEPFYKVDVPKNGVVVEPRYDLDLGDKEPFAYRFALRNKSTGKIEKYVNEDNKEYDGCTVITRKGTTVLIQGPMYLPIADRFAIGFRRDPKTGKIIVPTREEAEKIAARNRKSTSGFANSYGGTMVGLEAKIPELSKNFRRIVPTPMNGGDSTSAPGYWNENNFLPIRRLGTVNDYKALVRTAGRYDMNLVEDGTFTSEGLQGIHMQRAIKWMDSSDKPAEYYYFRMTGILNDSLKMGVVPRNYENLSHKLVNSPFDYVKQADGSYKEVKNKHYNPEKPTVLQVFDSSMVTEEEKNDKTKVIKKYSKLAPDGDNKLAINTHDDTLIPYAFEVDPYEYRANIRHLNDLNSKRAKDKKIEKDSPQGTLVMGAMSGIEISQKDEGGFVCWNAYTDMAKYNYFTSNYDSELLSAEKDPEKKKMELERCRRANNELQDMATSVARYRTGMVRNVLNEYVAKTIGEIPSNSTAAYKQISNMINSQNPNNPLLPASMNVSKNVVKNAIEDNYEFREKPESYDEILVSSLMDLPLDSIEFAPEVQGALSSPYLSKRSPDAKHVGQTRYEAKMDSTYKVPKEYEKTYQKMDYIFENDMKDFADRILKEVNKNSKEPLFNEGEVTEYGKYIIPLVAQDIAKYAIVKSLLPDAKVSQMPSGEITYDYDDMTERGTLRHFDVNGDSQKDEANQLVNRIKHGFEHIDKKDVTFLAESISKRFENTNVNSFKLAEAMVNQSGLGLDWRFDASKDVADIDSVSNAKQHFDTAWKNNIRFWGNMVDAISRENPNSYTVAELTDIDGLIKTSASDGNKEIIYDSEGKAIGALLDLAGISSEANYSYFFDGITNMFGRDFSTGDDKVGNQDKYRVNMLEDSLRRFSEKPIDYKRNSYTFASNHDKPRMIHCLSIDMNLFHADLSNLDNVPQRAAAYMLMNDIMFRDELSEEDWKTIKEDKKYFRNVSSRAIANGQLLRSGIGKAVEDMKNEELASSDSSKHDEIVKKYNGIYASLSKSVADVVKGDYYKMTEDEGSKDGIEKYKRVLEKDGFGVLSVPDAFDVILDQAVEKHDLDKHIDKEKLRNKVDERATEVGRAKTRIIMKFLSALPGNPTLYYGDEFGMTGNEDKSGNLTLKNRPPLDHTQIDKGSKNYRADVDEYRKSILDIFGLRKDSDMNRLEALNNGTSYKLALQNGYEEGYKDHAMDFSAVMAQASNGAMNISVLNPNGISTDNEIDVKNVKPTNGEMESIKLRTEKGSISLDEGTTFRNILDDDGSEYKVCEEKGEYVLRRFVDGKQRNIVLDSVTSPDGVMMLYHLPEEVENSRKAALKSKRLNPVYHIPQEGGGYPGGGSEVGRKLDISK